MIKKYRFNIGALLLMFVLWGCGGDNGTGVNPGDPPSLPDLTVAQPDFSYFEQAQKALGKSKAGDAYGSASMTVMSAGFLFASGQLGLMYFELAENEQAVYKDGQWVWSYGYSSQGQSFEMELTSRVNEDANEATWALYLSYSGGEESYDHVKYMEGTVSLDGKNGNWKFYTPTETGGSETLMSYEWSTDSSGNLTATFSIPGDDSLSSMEYVEDGSIHKLAITGSDGTTVVYWNIEKDHGYWQESGEQICWTSDKSDIACSDIGL